MILSIHQPNFIPWKPFFDKIQQSDIFVLLTKCQFEKNGFQNRFSYQDKWYTMPIFYGLDVLEQKRYKDCRESYEAIKRKLPKHTSTLERFDQFISDSLIETNTQIITQICKEKSITTKLCVDFDTEKKSTDRLIEICKHFNADTYLSGPSGKNYMDLKRFEEEGIRVIFQETKNEDKVPYLEWV